MGVKWSFMEYGMIVNASDVTYYAKTLFNHEQTLGFTKFFFLKLCTQVSFVKTLKEIKHCQRKIS